MNPTKIKIDLNELSKGKVIANGVDLSNMVTTISILAHAGETPEITLQLGDGVSAEIKGLLNILEGKK